VKPYFPTMSACSAVGIAAAAFNGTMLIWNVGFLRSESIAKYNRNLFSVEGQVAVLLWASAYAAAAVDAQSSSSCGGSTIWLIFAVEKMWYFYTWIRWNQNNDGIKLVKLALQSHDKLDVLAPLFHTLYGICDLTFGIMFAWLWLS